MDFAFTEAQEAVSGLSKKIFAERIGHAMLKTIEASDDRFARALWDELATVGLLGTTIAEEYGGGGHGILELCALLEQAGAAVAPLPLWTTLAVCAPAIEAHGSEALKKRVLPAIAAGNLIVTAALVEPHESDPFHPETRARRHGGGGWSLSGRKSFVPYAHVAHSLLVPARHDDGALGVFLVDAKADGVQIERQHTTSGEIQGLVTLAGVHVEDQNVVGDATRGHAVLETMLPRAQVGLCAMELGVVERVLRMTAEYTTQRHQFDRPIATFQAVSQRAADAFIDVESIRLSLWQAAWQLSQGRNATQAVATARLFACEAGRRVVYAAQHLHGGIGFDLDYPLHRYYVWSKQIELTLGAAPDQLAKLGAELAKG